MPNTLKRLPVNHRYIGTSFICVMVGNDFTLNSTKSKANIVLQKNANELANKGFFSRTPNRAFNPPCIAKNTPPIKANSNKP